MKAAPPPQDLDAEESVLGAMMLSAKAIKAVRPHVDAGDFYRETHGVIYDVSLRIADSGQPVDAITVADSLERMGRLAEIGGPEKIQELASLVPVAANAAHYAQIVRRHADRRRKLNAALVYVEALKSGADERIEQAESGLYTASRAPAGVEVVTMAEALIQFDRDVRNPPDLSAVGIPTPWSFLKPFMPGRLYILGGYQGDGKTATMGQFVETAAKAGRRTGVVSIEMTWQDLTDRFISSYGVPASQVEQRVFTPAAQRVVDDAMREMTLWPVDIIDDPSIDPKRIRQIAEDRGWEFIVIDHLHRFNWQGKREVLETIVRDITNIAKTLRVPVVLLAQLKRPYGTDRATRPTMSMLRESGMIEAEAAMVAFLYRKRDDYNLRTHDAEFIVAKNRFGLDSHHDLIFNDSFVRFEEPPEWEEAA